MNRIAIMLNAHGEFDGVFSDEPIAVFIIDPNSKDDRVYAYGAAVIGFEGVDDQVRGFVPDPHHAHGHAGVALRKAPKPKPALRIVDKGDDDA